MGEKNLKDVFFLPYVGSNYENGLLLSEDGTIVSGTESDKGLKVMVLGESHYCGEECVECGLASTCKKEACRKFTQDVLTCYLGYLKGKEGFESWMNTFTKFGKALKGKDERSTEIWESVIFYNYVQRAMNATRTSPSYKDFEDSESAFFEILEKYQPNIIITWGRRLYNNLPSTCGDFGKTFIVEGEEYYTWVYSLGDIHMDLLSIYHPSVGFDWKYWNNVIVEFFKIVSHE